MLVLWISYLHAKSAWVSKFREKYLSPCCSTLWVCHHPNIVRTNLVVKDNFLCWFWMRMRIFEVKTLMFLTLWQWFAKLGVTRIISGFDLGSTHFVITITVQHIQNKHIEKSSTATVQTWQAPGIFPALHNIFSRLRRPPQRGEPRWMGIRQTFSSVSTKVLLLCVILH